jgi:hypothetical protein
VRRYERKGLDDTAERMVGFLRERGIDGASLLEIGGGIGAIQVELLRMGAARATNLELSPEYETAAHELLRERGLGDRVDRRLGDVVSDPELAGPADAVIMHRVVCCYPDYERLLAAAGRSARRLLVFSHPPRNAVSRLFIAAENVVWKILGREYRAFAHPPSEMLEVLERGGLRRSFTHHTLVWQIAGLER